MTERGCFNCRGALNGWWSGAESFVYGQLKLNLFIALAEILEREGASHDPAFIVLVFIKWMSKGSELKIFFCCLRDLRASHQAYRERVGII